MAMTEREAQDAILGLPYQELRRNAMGRLLEALGRMDRDGRLLVQFSDARDRVYFDTMLCGQIEPDALRAWEEAEAEGRRLYELRRRGESY